jgi:hypothetical protein
MPTLTLEYVCFGDASTHPRQPRPINSSRGFAPIGDLSGVVGTLQNPSSFQVQPGQMQSPLTVANAEGTITTYKFSFVNISGGTPNGLTSFDNTAATPVVTVGANPILALVVYVPVGGGSGGAGAYIDAFDVTLNTLVSDTFVTVSPDAPPPPNGALTNIANVDGSVATTNTETITALQQINPTGADFDFWLDVANPQSPPPGEIVGLNFTAAQNSSPYALAFYKTPPPPPPPDRCHALATNVEEMIAKEGALNIPIGVREQLRTSLLSCEGELGAAEVNALITSLFPSQPPSGGPGKPR